MHYLYNSLAVPSWTDTFGISDEISDEPAFHPKPVRIPLAVKDSEADVIGSVQSYIEIAQHVLPEKETVGVVKNLRVDAIIGLNIIEPYNIVFEKDLVRFKEQPPRTFLF